MAERRRLRRALRLLGAAAVAAVLWLILPLGLRHLEFFRVRRVEIVGLQYLDAARVLGAAKIPPRASIYDDHAPIAARLQSLPGVPHAAVGSRARAEVLPFDPLGSSPDLPVLIGGGALVAGALARVKELDPALFARIDAAWRVGPDVVFEVGGRWYWFDSGLTAEDIRAVTAVEQALARQGRAFGELDGRFDGQVVVRQGRA